MENKIHCEWPEHIYEHKSLLSCEDFNPVEFVRVKRFAE